ncbi:choline/ethanolamine kinase family protein [Oryzicola mucosus]|uniref:Phosphotransferase family protein n=1 Tax=Oryzicola mucosus TaxID=2767425 RepID=A0A8J6PQK0_9HYPH|nr:choline/ethanolamine kinase family protein [Oryzicola mucosus]MBD0416962.1 phosphotransferase family protein [Oryzicola mucosus]
MITIEQAIEKTGMWTGRPARPERIASGITNVNWRICLDDTHETFFLKIHGPGTENLIDRELAHEATIKAAATGYAPQLLFYDEADGIEVYEFLHGFRSCNVIDLQHPTIRANILKAYKAIHSSQFMSRTKTGFDQLNDHLSRLKEIDAELPEDMDHILWQVSRARDAIQAAGMETCACFNDAYVYNYMVNDALDVKIIDWEYASGNDPYWDIAMFSFESVFIGENEIEQTLALYNGASDAATAARVYLYIGVACIVWGCWATYQSRTSSIPFDFGKYADILFLRGRAVMTVPEWDRALATV